MRTLAISLHIALPTQAAVHAAILGPCCCCPKSESSPKLTPSPFTPAWPRQAVIHTDFLGPRQLAAIFGETLLNVHPPT